MVIVVIIIIQLCIRCRSIVQAVLPPCTDTESCDRLDSQQTPPPPVMGECHRHEVSLRGKFGRFGFVHRRDMMRPATHNQNHHYTLTNTPSLPPVLRVVRVPTTPIEESSLSPCSAGISPTPTYPILVSPDTPHPMAPRGVLALLTCARANCLRPLVELCLVCLSDWQAPPATKMTVQFSCAFNVVQPWCTPWCGKVAVARAVASNVVWR